MKQRGALRPAFRRIGVAPRGIGLGLRIGRAFHHALIGMDAVDREMIVPAFRQIRIELGPGGACRMDVAIGDRGFDGGDLQFDLGTVTELDVHGVVSSTLSRP